ncbi:MAG: Cell division protein FtsX [Candidatus Dichloromethanomonas elyunquensis]|nr:MAG: Cell division protein FtsX [Candidatus Dichloromethanomonas elyunquensis]
MMKNYRANAAYFIKEAVTIFRFNLFSNILSLFSIALIFFIFAMMFSGWQISNHAAEALQGEAEINVYYNQNIGTQGIFQLSEKIKGINGIKKVRLVDEKEAYSRMEKILGEESSVLKIFDENPFNPYLEIKIDLEQTDLVLNGLKVLPGIEHVRNNKEVLDRVHSIAGTIRIFGSLVLFAVGLSTLVIVSHMLRQGIEHNREQINTLRLLGASEVFIGIPYLLEGLLLTMGGGILSGLASEWVVRKMTVQLASVLPFMPFPQAGVLCQQILFALSALSIFLGIAGSMLALSSAKPD